MQPFGIYFIHSRVALSGKNAYRWRSAQNVFFLFPTAVIIRADQKPVGNLIWNNYFTANPFCVSLL